jgi:energy-coupling factor transporter transmembrane protein EcfT
MNQLKLCLRLTLCNYQFMNLKLIFITILFTFTYLLSVTSVLYTESFVLFLAILFLFAIYLVFQESTYTKDEMKWTQMVKYYISIQNWNKLVRLDNERRMCHLLLLSLQIQKHEIEWVKKNISLINKRDYYQLQQISLRRLEVLSSFKKQMKLDNAVFGIRRLPLSHIN